MAAEIPLTVAGKAAEYLAAPVGRQFGYLIRFKKNVENMKLQVQNLDDKRDGVQRAVVAATMNGQEIKKEVLRWLENVAKLMSQAGQLENEVTSKKIWASRYKLSKEAVQISEDILKLLTAVNMENVSYPLLPPSSTGIVSEPLPPPSQTPGLMSPPPPGAKGLSAGPSSLAPVNIEFESSLNFMAFESNKSTMHQIIEALRDEKCDMIGVIGMGGVGKTTLVKEIGKKVKQHRLFDEVTMAVVSQTPDVRKIQGQIADSLGLRFSEESEPGRADRLYARIKGTKSILVILDDVWENIDLKDVGIPHGAEHEGCKIVLTTRRENVCAVMGVKPKTIHVNVLSAEESWGLFQNNTGGAINSPHLKNVALDVIRECQGLPIALVTVGRALRDKAVEEWNDAIQQLMQSRATYIEGMDQQVFSCLKLSYNFLPREETKVCFLFCCLFPEDYDIEIEYLARLAMGKGLFSDVITMVEARSRVRTITKYLKASCLLLDGEKDGCVKMHDVVRDVAISLASESPRPFFVKTVAGLKEWPRNERSEHSYSSISLMGNDIQAFPKYLNCPQLETLLLRDNEGFDNFPDTILEGLTELKVLDLSERTGIRTLPMSNEGPRILSLQLSFEHLRSLRTLMLDKCRLGNISALGTLDELEILSLSGSDIKALPVEIGNLRNLRLLDLSFCQSLEILPANVILRLSRLEELYMGCSFKDWEVEVMGDERTNACLSELQALPNLARLCVELKHKFCFPQNFSLPHSTIFEISVGCNSVHCYPSTRSLSLREIDIWSSDRVKPLLNKVDNLKLFCVEGDMDYILPNLDEGGLNSLKSLKVAACVKVFAITDTSQISPQVCFSNLEELHLRSLDAMMVLGIGPLPPGSLKHLRVLTIEYCRSIWDAAIPNCWVHSLHKLEAVTVHMCKTVKKIFEDTEITVGHENMPLFSNLKKISLDALPCLNTIWWGPDRSVSFSNLSVLEIRDCESLDYIFTPYISQRLVNLEILKIGGCNKMEVIFEEFEDLLTSEVQAMELPNLKVVKVESCKQLKSLFTVSIAPCLPELEELSISRAEKLEEIIGSKESAESKDEEDNIVLLRLSRMELKNLRCLKKFCPTGFTIDLPILKELVLDECPELKNIASDYSSYGLKAAPELAELRVDGQVFSGLK